jgi:hypothetical protein
MEAEVVLIPDYTEKSFAVVGDTKPIKYILGKFGSLKFNDRLKVGPGWVGSSSNLASFEAHLKKNHIAYRKIPRAKYEPSANKPTPQKPAVVKSAVAKGGKQVIFITNYTSGGVGHNSFAVVGTDESIAPSLKGCGLLFNARLKVGPGWIGRGSKIDAARKCLTEAGINYREVTLEEFNRQPEETEEVEEEEPEIEMTNDTIAEILYSYGDEFKCHLAADYLAEHYPDDSDVILNDYTLFIPTDDAVEYVRGLLRNIPVEQLFDIVFLNHITADSMGHAVETGQLTMLSGITCSYLYREKKISRIPIIKTDGKINIITGVIADASQHLNLNRA